MVKVLIVGPWYTKHIVRLCGKIGSTKKDDEVIDALDTYSFYDNRVDIPQGLNAVYGLKHFTALKLFMKIPKIRAIVRNIASIYTFRSLIRSQKYNLVTFQGANPETASQIRLAQKNGIRIHFAPLGSEVLRASRWQEKKLRYIFRNADYVTTSYYTDFGRTLINYYKIKESQFVSAGYGSDVVTYMLHYKSELSKKEISERLQIPYSSYYVACGYCANREQNHKEILYALADNKNKLPDDYLIVVQLSYGVFKNELYQELSDLAKQLSLNVFFIRDFLSTEQVAMLRRLIDLFIHVQKTDATNASIMEYLLGNTTIINGAWLKYSYLESNGKPYYTCDSLAQLPQCINQVLSGTAEPIVDSSLYREAITVMKDWDLALERWHELFHRQQ